MTTEEEPIATTQDVYSARLRACDGGKGFPFLSYGLLSLVPILTEKVPTAAVDKYWRLYVNPKFFGTLTQDQGAMVLVHEIWHLLLEHSERADTRGIAKSDHDMWNIAADIEINQHDDLFKRLPGQPATHQSFKFPPNLLAEEYYELLQKMPKITIHVHMPGSGECGSCAHGDPGEYELPPPTMVAGDGSNNANSVPGVSMARAKIIAQEVAKQIQDAVKSRGNVPGNWERWAERYMTPKVDYRAFLRQTIQGEIISKSGYTYPSYRKVNRRQHLSPNMLRPYYKDIQPHVAMIIDTSGSMSDDMVGQGLAEVDGVMKSFSQRAIISVYFTDSAAAAVQKVQCSKDLRPIGGGGTDMGAGFEAIARDRIKNPSSTPGTIIVITDGYTGWPEFPPDYANVVIVLVAEGTTAPWALTGKHRTIKIIVEPKKKT